MKKISFGDINVFVLTVCSKFLSVKTLTIYKPVNWYKMEVKGVVSVWNVFLLKYIFEETVVLVVLYFQSKHLNLTPSICIFWTCQKYLNLNILLRPAFTYSESTIETPKEMKIMLKANYVYRRLFGVFTFNFEHISHLAIVFLLFIFNMWEAVWLQIISLYYYYNHSSVSFAYSEQINGHWKVSKLSVSIEIKGGQNKFC